MTESSCSNSYFYKIVDSKYLFQKWEDFLPHLNNTQKAARAFFQERTKDGEWIWKTTGKHWGRIGQGTLVLLSAAIAYNIAVRKEKKSEEPPVGQPSYPPLPYFYPYATPYGHPFSTHCPCCASSQGAHLQREAMLAHSEDAETH